MAGQNRSWSWRTYESLDGRCACGHMIDEHHTAEINMKEEQDKRATVIEIEEKDQYGKKKMKTVKLERFTEFKVRIVCDYCKQSCRHMRPAGPEV